MNTLHMSLATDDGHEVTMTKTVPSLDCLERDDLVQTFCNFLEMAGYVFPSESSTVLGEELEKEMNSYDYNDFLRKRDNKAF